MCGNGLIKEAEEESKELFFAIEKTALFNQRKVLDAFRKNRIALRHFAPSTGYGYEDEGKGALASVFKDAFRAEAAIVSPLLASGTHAISTALFGVLRPKDEILSVTGMPYDTLVPVLLGKGIGSLAEFGVKFCHMSLSMSDIEGELGRKPRVVFIQRSRGYTERETLSIERIAGLICKIKRASPKSIIVVDNCYGEFTEKKEPLEVGADVIVGSLIKNPGGGLAPTGGYICGKENLIKQIENRLTAPGVGGEIGSFAGGYREFFQGFFMAPTVAASALKGAILFSAVFRKLGYCTLPKKGEIPSDIICSIKFNQKEKLLSFCSSIQESSPIDSFVRPIPWDMPGYKDKVIMAAGAFVQGASIELSADSPIREPYIAFVQGGLTYEHIKIALEECVAKFALSCR